ncbi:MAG TPA: peptidase C13 family protein [Acinetobacter ursingii]|uniref:Peptidase C13 family protein n=1 Tax=Acinetobacter ursingii TaxID=108980 RepID=A0A3D2SNY8_9GAMM|nr:C13 family peptidase [Acinetobacter ursingii]MCH2006390.1 C13 family peptidase [Acinetobacter ursingii]MCU4305494.1 C13 family peptidase [Acinetobacter ursingii]MCU4371500.1 C13 family peptidase [Acinetobacter ursingii]MCU4380989.1 C13 family peptidase [Acinetobacter ursingii]MDG9992170.1 C13 family peptidase [Acinetobacter ursingii]
MIDLKPSINFWHDFKSNQIAGMWLFLGSRRCLQIVHPSIFQLLVWGVLGGAANTLFSWLVAGQDGQFNSQGLVSYALWPFLALIVGIFLSQRTNNARLMLVPAILWLVLDTNIALLQSFIQFLGQLDYLPYITYDYLPTLFMVLFVWQSLAVVWVFARELKWPWWERALIMIATLVTLVVWQGSVRSQPIWKVEDVAPTFTEDAFYAQSRLLNQSLEQIQYGEFAQSHWYFLGVAGASYQDVFKSEIMRIKEQFDTRFGTFGRSMMLINNPDTRTEVPIASQTSIGAALRRMGQQMNKESDVLFLYMTSHGAPNEFEMENAPLDLHQVDPKWLRETLDKSGIRWRVIVISSCYSGSFIPALQSPDTLIITASAADRQSFGCTNEADYTYFGRALFDQAMRDQHTMKDAFKQAQDTVAKWESAQGFEPSEPQWVMGKNMELMLPQLEQHLFPQQNLPQTTTAAKHEDKKHANVAKKSLL